MRILFLMNDEGSPPGVLLEETLALGHEPSVLVPYKGISHDASLPGDVPEDADAFDGLVVLGGVMSVLDEADYPFIEATRCLMRAFDTARKPVMGVCLGAQLMASAHGGTVRRLGHTEWGFLRQTWLPAAEADVLLSGIARPGLPLMQWHGDTFDLPPDAVPLSTREDCPAQAFRLGTRNWGFQFHLELDEPTLLRWAELRAAELKVPAPAIIDDVRSAIAAHYTGQAAFARQIMRRWLALCAGRDPA